MSERRIYQALAEAFHAEGVRSYFCLTGDGNMHWEAALAALPGTHGYHARHEHAACAMATAHARATGEVGIASVTCGPGLTQIMTALATAAQARIPLVVFAGEDPIDASWYNQRIDQEPLVLGTGAAYVAARSAKLIEHHVMEAFMIARTERRPVVLAVPLDLQKKPAPGGSYVPSRELLPDVGPRFPNPAQLDAAAERIRAAERIVILAGHGAHRGGCRADCARLAEICDAALAVSLPARGLFNGNPRYIGVSGGFAHVATREAFQQADLIVAVGVSLASHTSDMNLLFSPEDVIQIDDAPPVLKHGQVPARLHVVADARLALEGLIARLSDAPGSDAPGSDVQAPDAQAPEVQTSDSPPRRRAAGWDVPALARRVREETPDPEPAQLRPGLLDPRDVAAALSSGTDTGWAHVASSGHCSYFTAHLHDRDADDFLTIREFGAIGNGLSYAIGRWAARPDQPVMLTDGDGGFLMHVQELETVARYGMKMLICIFNDGAYGSEIHKLRSDGLDDHGAVFGHRDLAALARGFGLEGHRVTDLAQVPDLARAFRDGSGAVLWDFHVSDTVMAPTMRRQTRNSPLRADRARVTGGTS